MYALRKETTHEERLAAMREAREEEKKQRWAAEEDIKRKQKLGMYDLPPLDEEEEGVGVEGGGGSGGGGGVVNVDNAYKSTIAPGQHKTAKTLERALRAGKGGAGNEPPQSFAGDVDDGNSPSLKGKNGSTRLVFHCYDQEIAACDAQYMGKEVFKYERQALRRRVKSKSASFI